MSNLKEKTLGLLGFLLAMSLSTFSAQAQEDVVEEAQVEIQEADEDETEEIVVTGSRLRKNAFTSISPLQVISTEASREVGLIDPASILQESTQSAGQQIDLTFQGFVLDNGPGASTASLRGLGASRTLILVNGRRVAPSGVEGAPSAPDLNLIPSALVQRYDILSDGASSVYGSDAVAGVINVIMKKDFDGLELELNTSIPEQSNGIEHTISASYGKNYDRGFFGVGIEYETTDEVTFGDRDSLDECDKHLEIDQAGTIRDVGFDDQFFNGQGPSNCKRSGLAGRFIVGPGLAFGGFGSIYYTPGQGNALADWSESGAFGAVPDADGDGIADVDFQNHIINGNDLFTTLFPENERFSFMSYGEYTFRGDMNLTAFGEVMYNRRETFADSGAFQLFPTIAAENPFNPCNPNGINGVDCGLAWDAFFQRPDVIASFMEAQGGNAPSAFGLGSFGAIGATTAQIVASVRGDRTQVTSELDQTRFVAGLRGDLPMIPVGGNNDWKFEVALVNSKSDGTASRPGIRQDRIDAASTTIQDPTSASGLRCDTTGDGVLNSTDGCFLVNFFAPSLYENVVGDFATQAERDFLFDSRDFRTEYEQTIGSIFINGSLFDLPGGTAQGGIGYQYRDDDINSIPDDIARDGLFFGFFADGGAVGNKYTQEYFAEIDLPLLANKNFAKELTVNLSGNRTKDELFGYGNTFSAKVGYRPIDSLLIRGTRGTSYRAPNLRENFLRDQTGFGNVTDPCVVPDEAFDQLTNTYDPAEDGRRAEVLANCLAQGVDPTTFVNGGIQTYSTEIARGGAGNLVEETSDSYTYGFSFQQPWFDEFDANLGVTYYDIEINNSIIEPTAGFIVGSCFNDRELDSAFCSRLPRDPVTQRFDVVDGSFLNRDAETANGIDVNASFDKSITLYDRAFDLGLDLNMNRTIHRETVQTGLDADTGETTTETTDFAGSFGFPDWQGNLQSRIVFGDYRFTWGTRYIGDVTVREAIRDDFSDINGTSSTCFGNVENDIIPNDGLLCRDVDFAASYVTHSASLFYRGDVWTIGGGISNVFDKAPPRVDSAQVTAINNTPIGFGYDINGRRYFFNVSRKFEL